MARADDIDTWTAKLIDMEQRAGSMIYELKDAPPPSPDVADRRVIDAQVLFNLKNYEEAATILLDVVDKYPGTRAYDDAIYLLGESLYQAQDFHSARALPREGDREEHGLEGRDRTRCSASSRSRCARATTSTSTSTWRALQNVPLANMEPRSRTCARSTTTSTASSTTR